MLILITLNVSKLSRQRCSTPEVLKFTLTIKTRLLTGVGTVVEIPEGAQCLGIDVYRPDKLAQNHCVQTQSPKM